MDNLGVRCEPGVSFGYGIHFCIGAALGRMPGWTVDHERAVRLHTSTVRGWINVPVRV